MRSERSGSGSSASAGKSPEPAGSPVRRFLEGPPRFPCGLQLFRLAQKFIAEGFERGSKEEFLYFLYIAKGACGEVRAQLYIALDCKYITQEEFNIAVEKCKQVSGLLYKFIESIKSQGYSGLRHKKTPEQVENLYRS